MLEKYPNTITDYSNRHVDSSRGIDNIDFIHAFVQYPSFANYFSLAYFYSEITPYTKYFVLPYSIDVVSTVP